MSFPTGPSSPRRNAEYEALPAAIRARYTLTEWLWLSNDAKRNLIQTETEPEHTE